MSLKHTLKMSSNNLIRKVLFFQKVLYSCSQYNLQMLHVAKMTLLTTDKSVLGEVWQL